MALVAGQRYFIQVLYKEGIGGDYAQVAAKLDVDPTPPDSLAPIPAAYLAAPTDFAGATLRISDLRTNGTGMSISFKTDGPFSYRLESKDRLAPGPWTIVPGTTIRGNGAVMTVQDPRPRSPTNRFYRAVMTP
jgi:hypothetical protein